MLIAIDLSHPVLRLSSMEDVRPTNVTPQVWLISCNLSLRRSSSMEVVDHIFSKVETIWALPEQTYKCYKTMLAYFLLLKSSSIEVVFHGSYLPYFQNFETGLSSNGVDLLLFIIKFCWKPAILLLFRLEAVQDMWGWLCCRICGCCLDGETEAMAYSA